MKITIFINLFFVLGVLAAQAGDAGNDLSRFIDRSNRLGTPIEMYYCPISGELVTTVWVFEGRIVSATHTCDEKCYRPAKEKNRQKEMVAPIPYFDATTNGLEDSIAAVFSDGATISLQEVKDLFGQLPPELQSAPFSKLYVSLLNRLVDSKLLLDAAKSEQLDGDIVVLASIINANKLLLQKEYLDKRIEEMVTDDILRIKYDELVRCLPKDEMESEVCHILFDNKRSAEITLRELQFSDQNIEERFNHKVALQSLDSSTKTNKGNIGWVRKTHIQNEELFMAAKGTLVPQVLKIFDQGYSIFFIKNKRPIQAPEFEKIKVNIKMDLIPQYAVMVVDKMRRDSGLQLTGLDGKPMPLPDLPPMPDASEKELEPIERKYFSGVDEKALDNLMVVGVFANVDTITLDQVRDSIASAPEQIKNSPFCQSFEPLVLRLADAILLIDAAKKAGFEASEDLLKKQEETKKGLFQRAYLDKQFAQVITPTMLSEAYQEFLKFFYEDNLEISLSHIVVATKEEALSIIEDLKCGDT